MSGVVRRAGRFVDLDGRTVTWSVADGRRGRRWRWAIDRGGGGVAVSHTLETDPEGAFVKLESAAAAVLLTLHREPDGSVHGNRVGEGGVEHLRFGAVTARSVLAGSSPMGLAVLVSGLPPLAEASPLDLLDVSGELRVRAVAGRIVPEGRATLRLEIAEAVHVIEVDADGLPVIAGDTTAWPLEEG